MPAAGCAAATRQGQLQDEAVIAAPVSGALQAWKVADGQTVQAGQPVAALEAMKMEMQVTAHRSGRLTHLARASDQVQAGDALARIEIISEPVHSLK